MWSSYQSISSRRCEAIGRPGRQGPGGRRAFLDDLLGARRQGRADLGREVQEVLVTGEPLQGRLHQIAGAADIAALVGQLGLQKLKLWAAERGVASQPVEAVLDLGADQPLQQQAMPLGQVRGPTVTLVDRKSTRLNSSHVAISYAVFCLKKKKKPGTALFLINNKKVKKQTT